MKDAILEKDIQKVIHARHNAPHTILGSHYSEKKDAIVIRAGVAGIHRLLLNNQLRKAILKISNGLLYNVNSNAWEQD